jgi:hypothetical protein
MQVLLNGESPQTALCHISVTHKENYTVSMSTRGLPRRSNATFPASLCNINNSFRSYQCETSRATRTSSFGRATPALLDFALNTAADTQKSYLFTD